MSEAAVRVPGLRKGFRVYNMSGKVFKAAMLVLKDKGTEVVNSKEKSRYVCPGFSGCVQLKVT